MNRGLALAALLLFAGCDTRPEWKGRIFTQPDDNSHFVNTGPFQTFDECEADAQERIAALKTPSDGSFMCSYKCRWSKKARTEICEDDRN